MSTRTIFFVATAGEALTMDLSVDLLETTNAESKNITPDIVGDLDFLLTGEREREPICLRDEENFVVYRLDDELVNALAELDEEQVPRVAGEWGIFDTRGTTVLVSDLRTLAKMAMASDEEMFLTF